MAEFDDPIRARIGRVETIEEYYELKEKGGVFKKLNVRVYFTVEPAHRAIIVLSVYKKEEEGQLSRHMKKRNSARLKAAKAQLAKHGVQKK